MEAAFTDENDDRIIFLNDFLSWLTCWKGLNLNHGILTTDTFNAIYQNVNVMIDFIKYSLNQLNVNYVLPGKLQTDKLENRFSRYRQLSGKLSYIVYSNY